ncbi:pH-response regulator protein palC [Apiospora arundinis]
MFRSAQYNEATLSPKRELSSSGHEGGCGRCGGSSQQGRGLIYPDALSLKHTCRYFYELVNTGVRLKVEWLVQRRMLHLECPNDKRCDLGSDLKFCRGSVPLLMQRRREHMECESRPGLGCLVFSTKSCAHRPQLQHRWKKWLRLQLTIELWWVLLALVPIILGWMWMLEVVTWVRRS